MRARGSGTVAMASLVALVATTVVSCAADFDTSRVTPPCGTLGTEMFTMVCDRVGAQALREDVPGASYHAVCHADANGAFATEVDESKLPLLDPAAVDATTGLPVPLATQTANRAHRIARIQAVARRRVDLVTAFDTAFTNEVVATKDLANPDPARSCDPPPGTASGMADLRTELAAMLGRLGDLYDDDTIPHFTRALARMMDDVGAAPDAQSALARFDARRGYRPSDLAMGVARPALSYPRLAELANALLLLLSSDIDPLGLGVSAPPPGSAPKSPADRSAADRVPGKAHGALVDMLSVLKEELRTAQRLPDLPPLAAAPDARDPTLTHLSRPRGNLEMLRTIFLAQDPAFATGAPRWITTRDARGYAKVARVSGEVPAPFVDLGGDGLPDVDALGRFVTRSGAAAPPPFPAFAEVGAPADADKATARDGQHRALLGAAPMYESVDVASTYLASLSRDLVPLFEPDPARSHETVMDLLAGLVVVAGKREAGKDSVRAYQGNQVAYRAYREDQSPLLDLVYAIGQVLGDPTTDDTLALLQRLASDKPQVLARLVGAGLNVKAIADRHPEASIPQGSTLWDEMFDVLVQIAQKPALAESILRALGDDRTPALATAGAAYMVKRDQLSYDRANINGPPFNVTTGRVESLVTPVDRSKPDTGTNRSAFQRFGQTLHDANGLSICTKKGAVAHIVWNGIPLDYPSLPAQAACFTLGASTPPSDMPVCGMFRIENVAHDLVDAVLGAVNLDIRDDCLKKLVSSPLTGIVGGADAFLENVSGITGFNTKPSVPGISRVVYFDLPHDGTLGDLLNLKTLNFLRDLFDPIQSLACPAAPFTDTDGHVLNLRTCTSFADTIRGRDQDALFPLEQLGFFEAAKPLAQAFHDSDANVLFVNLFDVLHLHWGSKQQSAQECSPSAPRQDARWCSQDGAVTYEPLVSEALSGDLFPAMHDGVKELASLQIPHCDTRDPKSGVCTHTTSYDGVKVLAEALKAMVDPARNKGLLQRNGDAFAVRNDGTKNAQVTPLYLLVDALKGFDQAFADHRAASPHDDRQPQWRRARSQIVDQLFTVDGTGAASRLHDASVEKILPTLLGAVRSQIHANCTDPTSSCDWAEKQLPSKLRDVVTGPTFATVLDLLDAIRSDPASRGELERLMVYLLQSTQADAAPSTQGALVDLLQVFEDDAGLTALLHATSSAAAPEVLDASGHVASRGLLLAAIEVLSRMLGEAHLADGTRICAKEIDPNRTLPVMLRHLVTPPADGKTPAPIEVLIDVAADVNRARPETTTKLAPSDYASISHEVSDFCENPARGLEQVYTVIKQATQGL